MTLKIKKKKEREEEGTKTLFISLVAKSKHPLNSKAALKKIYLNKAANSGRHFNPEFQFTKIA